MALIKTRTEIKEVLPKLVSTLSDNSLLPNFERAEEKYLVPLIGRDLYTDLTTKYNVTPTPTTNDQEKLLLKKIRLVVVSYALLDELGLGNVTLADTGARKLSQGGTERVFAWEYQELKNTLMNAALDGTDVLLTYLYDTKDDWPDWTDSPQYTKYVSLLIKSGTDFNDNYTLFQPARSWWTMRSVMGDVQELFLEDSIGKDLLIYLRDATDPTDAEKESIRLLKKALSFLTVFQSCKHFSVSFTENGFTILGQKNMSTVEAGANGNVELSLLDMKMNECERQGRDFLAKARNYLVGMYADGEANFKTAFDKGVLTGYVQPADRTSGNETRKIYTM